MTSEPHSESDSSFPRLGLCFSFLTRLRLSSRCTGGGEPRAVRAMDLTAVVAVTVRNSILGHYLIDLLGPPAVVVGDVMGWHT